MTALSILTTYLLVSITLLFIILFWQTDEYSPNQVLSIGKKFKLFISAIMIIIIGLPLFFAGAACSIIGIFTSLSASISTKNFLTLSSLFTIFIFSVPTTLAGLGISVSLWRSMKKTVKNDEAAAKDENQLLD